MRREPPLAGSAQLEIIVAPGEWISGPEGRQVIGPTVRSGIGFAWKKSAEGAALLAEYVAVDFRRGEQTVPAEKSIVFPQDVEMPTS